MAKLRIKPTTFEAEQFFAESKPWPKGVQQDEEYEFYIITAVGEKRLIKDGDWIAEDGGGYRVLPNETVVEDYVVTGDKPQKPPIHVYLISSYHGRAIMRVAMIKETKTLRWFDTRPHKIEVIYGEKSHVPDRAFKGDGTFRVFLTEAEAFNFLVTQAETRLRRAAERVDEAVESLKDYTQELADLKTAVAEKGLARNE